MAAYTAQAAAEGIFDLDPMEIFWRDLQPYLLSKGYKLRPKYAPGWTPPWVGTDIYPHLFEETIINPLPWVVDAQREEDGMIVAIKWAPAMAHTRNEVDVLQFVSTPDMLADPRNHCNPLLDSFPNPNDPNGVLIVTPWLFDFYSLPIFYVNELVDFMLQLFEGVAFLHEHRVAHRDCTHANVMQDVRSAFPRLQPHPLSMSYARDGTTLVDPLDRCVCHPPIRYYLIDFGISSRFDGDGPYRVTGTIGRDPTAPELSDTVPYDPFKLDVYMVGNFFLQRYVRKYSNLEFLRPLLLRMTRQIPERRPNMEQALRALQKAARRPRGVAYRWRLREREEPFPNALVRDICALFREAYFQATHEIL
ncbi:hypothetical protein AURDEDRAFT_138671 [Auricularia subglabra TFB-10046 SS5]|uniref:Protein kinase domain-containing protein n=1 Tax=Auricularia subglabra (strain TFB-10046 / SS5) TaxID=717982 RepID=J0D2W4_AURST|nr:hypothetical protein AURDEDRAFT_138671 [Auricularia subglabra TFB-10046 SS5]